MSANDRVKRRRAEARAKGYCCTCVTKPVVPGKKRCADCIARGRHNPATLVQTPPESGKFCEDCAMFEGHRFDCVHASVQERAKGPLIRRPLMSIVVANYTNEDNQCIAPTVPNDSLPNSSISMPSSPG